MNSSHKNGILKSVQYTDWKIPFLTQASSITYSLLANEACQAGYDWTKLTVVFTPSKRTSRQLQEHICKLSKKTDKVLPSYEISTISNFSSYCFNKKFRQISKLDSILLWQHVLDEVIDEDSPLTNFTLDNAGMFFFNLRKKLSEASLKPSNIIDHIDATHLDLDTKFWNSASEAWERYEDKLITQELQDQYSIRYEHAPDYLKDSIESIIFAGCIEKPSYICKTIETLSIPVTHIIQAPEDKKEGFDVYGNCNPLFWKSYYPEIQTSQLVFPETEIAQLDIVIEKIKELKAAGFDENSITVTLLDQSSIGPLQGRLEKNNISFVAPGIDNVSASPLGSLCEKISKAICFHNEAYFELLQHPYFLKFAAKECGIEDPSEILVALDYLQINQLITSLSYSEETPSHIKKIIQSLRKLFSDLGMQHKIEEEYTDTYLKCISEVIERIKKDSSQVMSGAEHDLVKEVFSELSSSTHRIQPRLFHSLFKEALYSKDILKSDLDGIELFGWDETALHDSAASIIINCNEQNFPRKSSFDPILPERLKAQVGLITSDFYEASQLISLHSLLQSKEYMLFSCPKYNFNGDRNTLSKFLLLGNPEFTDVLKTFYSHTQEVEKLKIPAPSIQNILPKRPYEQFPLKSLSASKIKTYLECPFHFFVRHILQSECIEYESFELEHTQIGSLLHSVFNELSKQEEQEIPIEVADQVFYTQSKRLFGTSWSTPLVVQLDLLKLKNYAYCKWHALHRKRWKDLTSELYFNDENLGASLHGNKIPLVGIIDRVSYSPLDNTIKVIDFKTGDSKYAFSRALKKQGWVDPQLPLYALHIKKLHQTKPLKYNGDEIAADTPIIMSYVHFNKSGDFSEDVREYTDNTGEEILTLTNSVIDKIQNQEFWPPQKTSEITKRLFGNITFDYPLSTESEGESDD